jgi:hypothetical protein
VGLQANWQSNMSGSTCQAEMKDSRHMRLHRSHRVYVLSETRVHRLVICNVHEAGAARGSPCAERSSARIEISRCIIYPKYSVEDADKVKDTKS